MKDSKKLKVITEGWLTGPTGKFAGKNVEFGKIYTAKDMPPFQTPKQINEEDLEKGGSSLPSKVKIYMNKFVDELKRAKLNRIKEVAVLYKVISALGFKPQEISMYISKIKKEV